MPVSMYAVKPVKQGLNKLSLGYGKMKVKRKKKIVGTAERPRLVIYRSLKPYLWSTR